jgi:dihydroorotase
MGKPTIVGKLAHENGISPVTLNLDQSGERIESMDFTKGAGNDDLLIFPGFIDIHVHAREYEPFHPADEASQALHSKMTAKETFLTAGLAALNGGVTMYAAMPNDPDPPKDKDSYDKKKELSKRSPCPVTVFGCMCPDSEPWADIPYKVYLDAHGSVNTFSEWKDLEEVLARFAGHRVFFHGEDPEILRANTMPGPRWITRPAIAETVAVERILELTHQYGLKTHFCHISTKSAVDLIANYNDAAQDKVTCEVTPHHLSFSVGGESVYCAISDKIVEEASRLGSNPPIRSEDDRRFMVHALKSRMIDVLATDHAPHTIPDKDKGAPGLPHLDTLGPFVTWLLKSEGFEPCRIAQILSEKPLRILGSKARRGLAGLTPHSGANLTLLKLNEPSSFRNRNSSEEGSLMTRCGWTPYDGITFPGSTHSVYINGRKMAPKSSRGGAS